MNYFLLFLFCMVFFETMAFFLRKYGVNNGLYNLLSLLEFNILFLFYGKLSKDRLTKKVTRNFIYIYSAVFFLSSLNYGMGLFTVKYNTIAPVFGAAFIGVVLLLYLREILLSEEILNYKSNIYFWITTGLLLYYLGTMPLTAIFNFMKTGSSFKYLFKIQQSLTVVMHFCFIFGLLWNWKKVK